MLHLGFSLNSLLLCYLAMVVSDNESTTTKNAGKLLAISIAMGMRRYDAGRIARWSAFVASCKATKCRHQAGGCATLPWWPPCSLISNETHKMLTKHNF